jgi:phosphoribosylanthranilate isomerase
MNVRVKICGITRRDDALTAVAAGADALGFMFYERSPRFVAVEQAAAICRELPPLVTRVGVFVGASADFIRSTASACGLGAVQLHGGESPEFCRQFALPVIKAFRIRGPESLAGLAGYDTAAVLLDSYVPGQQGGTGARFDWSLAAETATAGRPIFLAGGLTAENVAEAVRAVRPYAVDVSSGVESAPGCKDPEKVRRFIAAVRAAATGPPAA